MTLRATNPFLCRLSFMASYVNVYVRYRAVYSPIDMRVYSRDER